MPILRPPKGVKKEFQIPFMPGRGLLSRGMLGRTTRVVEEEGLNRWNLYPRIAKRIAGWTAAADYADERAGIIRKRLRQRLQPLLGLFGRK